MRCFMLNLYLEGYGLKNMGPKLSLSKAYTTPLHIKLTAWVYDPSVNWQLKAILQQKSVKQSETKLEGSLKYYGANQKYSPANIKILNSCLQTTEKRMEIYPLKRDSKAQNKDQDSRSIVTTCTNTYKGFAFSTYREHNSAIERWNLIIPASLQDRAIGWYHCYLQRLSHSSLQKTIKSVKYWKRYANTTQ